MFEKIIKAIWLAIVLALVAAVLSKAIAYIRLHDIPLYPNVTQMVDSPQCEIVFFTNERPEVVRDFYRREMPKHGWILQRDNSYWLTFTHQHDESLYTSVQIEDWQWETKATTLCKPGLITVSDDEGLR